MGVAVGRVVRLANDPELGDGLPASREAGTPTKALVPCGSSPRAAERLDVRAISGRRRPEAASWMGRCDQQRFRPAGMAGIGIERETGGAARAAPARLYRYEIAAQMLVTVPLMVSARVA
jgi:hypothetical protein